MSQCPRPGRRPSPLTVGGGALGSVFVVFFTMACGMPAAFRYRLDHLDHVLAEAEAAGALRCAPRELALARAHRDFAALELRRGHGDRAEEHLEVAEPNAAAAIYLSPEEACSARAPAAAPLETSAPGSESEPEPETEPPPAEVTITEEEPDPDGDGIVGEADACPTRPEDFDGDEDEDGCPDTDDADADGVLDASDVCPNAPEDIDAFEDADGCPDPDNDADGIPDASDECPNAAEDVDGFQDADGCADPDNDGDGIADAEDPCPSARGTSGPCPEAYPGIEIQDRAIRILRPVRFTEEGELDPDSIPPLRSIAAALRDRPGLRVEIAAHSDSEGTDEENLERTQARAETVRRALLQGAGVDPSRVTARGYGEAFPIDTNTTPEGRAANQRIEVHRTDVGAP